MKISRLMTLNDRSQQTFELSLLLTLFILTVVFTLSKEFTIAPPVAVVQDISLKIEDIPITHQIKRPPPPRRPTLPVETDDPAWAPELTLPEITWGPGDMLPPPPPIEDESPVFIVVEQPPTLIGGLDALMSYIMKKDLYPVMARQAGVGGICMIEFVVDTAGHPTNISIFRERPVGLGFGQAGIEAIKAMRFTPGVQSDKKVPVKMVQVINFAIK